MKPTDKKNEFFSAKSFNISQNEEQAEVFTPHLMSAHSTIDKKDQRYGTFNAEIKKGAERKSMDLPMKWMGNSNPKRSSEGDYKS